MANRMIFDPRLRTNLNLTGERFGRWLVIGFARHTGKHGYWTCRCDCGTVRAVARQSLNGGHSQSCGCLQRERTAAANLVHGHARGRRITSEYLTWCAMKNRCFNPNVAGYRDYGERGITVCPSWRDSFERFIADMGPRPRGLSLERKDNDGSYSKENCIWATRSAQMNNKRDNHVVSVGGSTMNVTEAARLAGLPPSMVFHRIYRGWSEDRWFAAARSTPQSGAR